LSLNVLVLVVVVVVVVVVIVTMIIIIITIISLTLLYAVDVLVILRHYILPDTFRDPFHADAGTAA
jgi:hypothetical protein